MENFLAAGIVDLSVIFWYSTIDSATGQLDYRAIGASGAISGLMSAVGILFPFATIYLMFALPIWAGVIPVTTTVGTPEPDPRNLPGVEMPEHIRTFRL